MLEPNAKNVNVIKMGEQFPRLGGLLFPSSPYIGEGAFFLVNSLKMFNNTQK